LVTAKEWVISDGGLAGCDAFKMTIQTTTPNETFVIPTTGAGYDVVVDWGAGGLKGTYAGTTPDIRYTYLNPGTYQISLQGSFPRLYFNATGANLSNVVSIDHWGENQRAGFERAFAGLSGVAVLAEDTPQWVGQSARVSLAEMFAETTNLTGDFSHLDWSQVVNMSGMFRNAQGFNQPLS
jgi:hypothetical protein